MPPKHEWDQVADELLGWLDSESTYYADALRNGGPSPFAAPASEAQKLDFYRRQMYMTSPDGQPLYDQPNAEGRQKLLTRLGTKGYVQVYEAVRPKSSSMSKSPDEEQV